MRTGKKHSPSPTTTRKLEDIDSIRKTRLLSSFERVFRLNYCTHTFVRSAAAPSRSAGKGNEEARLRTAGATLPTGWWHVAERRTDAEKGQSGGGEYITKTNACQVRDHDTHGIPATPGQSNMPSCDGPRLCITRGWYPSDIHHPCVATPAASYSPPSIPTLTSE